YTPVWLMRQAGRYLPEYRAMRERFGFLELCRNPEAAAEVTLQPVDRLGVDAAILFADILLIVEPLDVGLEFPRGEGPLIQRPLRDEAQIARLRPIDVASAVPFVFEAARRVKQALAGRVPLIGFAGAPFTVASYVVEGGASREYLHVKRLMYEEPEAWHRLMEILATATARYLNGQIAADADAVQIFDSWVGVLAADDYRTFIQPHMRTLIHALTPGVPVIHFGTWTAALLPLLRAAGGDVMGLDWRVDLDTAWASVRHDVTAPREIRPFLEIVTRGRGVPPERLEEVARHYERMPGSRSPLCALTLAQARALERELARSGVPLPVFVGMRNWHPFLHETLADM